MIHTIKSMRFPDLTTRCGRVLRRNKDGTWKDEHEAYVWEVDDLPDGCPDCSHIQWEDA